MILEQAKLPSVLTADHPTLGNSPNFEKLPEISKFWALQPRRCFQKQGWGLPNSHVIKQPLNGSWKCLRTSGMLEASHLEISKGRNHTTSGSSSDLEKRRSPPRGPCENKPLLLRGLKTVICQPLEHGMLINHTKHSFDVFYCMPQLSAKIFWKQWDLGKGKHANLEKTRKMTLRNGFATLGKP